MAVNKVKVRKSHLDKFRKLARQSPYEIQAYLVGEVVNPNLTVIDYFAYAPRYAVQDRGQVAWYRSDFEVVRQEAEERGRRIVGQIHSHPEWDAVVSPSDYEISILDGFRICGICSTNKGSTRVRFWVMDSALPCEIVYAAKKRTQNSSQSATS